MKPTISNAFNDQTPESGGAMPATNWNKRLRDLQHDADQPQPQPQPRPKRNPHKSLAAALAPMQVDLRQTDFGWSLELSPMQAIDVLSALTISPDGGTAINYLCFMEQSAWRDGERELNVAQIAARLAISHTPSVNDQHLILDEFALRQLVSLCQPSRLVAVAVRGELDERDVAAINAAIDAGRSPLLAELRAEAAIEVLGDRALVLHVRDKAIALQVIAENFRHYLAALCSTPSAKFSAPQHWQLERLLDNTGALTIRPIETQQFSTSIDVGINTTRERFTQPADRSLIYDLPSHTWHDEP